MDEKSKRFKELEFIRNFVNAVYGILLGFGFSNAIWNIHKVFKDVDSNSLLIFSFHQYSFQYTLVLFAIIVLCVHWWDWRLGVSEYVSTNIIEFIINMLILLNIEWLFFEFNCYKNFSFLMTTLALFNFIWVVNFRIQRYDESRLTIKEYFYQRIVWIHILKRFLGVILYASLFIFYLNINQDRFVDTKIDEWLGLLLLFCLFLFDRIILYSNRKMKVGENEIKF
jgi:hypothetical protein